MVERSSVSTLQRWTIWLVFWFTMVYSVAYFSVVIGSCSPVRKSWAPSTPGSCLPAAALYWIPGGITIALDFIIMTIPIRLIWQLQMGRLKKVQASLHFIFGTAVVAMSIARLVSANLVLHEKDSRFVVMYGVLEINLGVRIYPSLHKWSCL